MKTAVIVGSEGQDGRIAFEQLSAAGYSVIGLDAGCARATVGLSALPVNIVDAQAVAAFLKQVRPDEVYYFAACHHSSEDKLAGALELYRKSHEVHVVGLLSFLDGIAKEGLPARLFYAASSLIFGEPAAEVQDETTPFAPCCIYGITKLEGLMLCRYYRRVHKVFAPVGIFYNHESPYRTENFLSKKIARAVREIQKNKTGELVLGDLSAEVDWGYAPDYVDAARRILSVEQAEDFIIASGTKHTVGDFARIAFEAAGLDGKAYVREDRSVLSRVRKPLIGDTRKLKAATGWRPTVNLKGMIRILLQAEGVSL